MIHKMLHNTSPPEHRSKDTRAVRNPEDYGRVSRNLIPHMKYIPGYETCQNSGVTVLEDIQLTSVRFPLIFQVSEERNIDDR